ncbi:MAG TPA: TIGR01777 family oxidoreductase [Terriglobia bacterium]|nr:TIGR01777 family oxidoreductase [Terriglobia bacterium]
MRILISGSTGLIGSAFIRSANAAGHITIPLVRKRGVPSSIFWDPESGVIDDPALEGIDAVLHLAGESIAARRWTEAQKARILESRVKGTALLTSALARVNRRPAVLVSSSAIGYYGDCGDRTLTESSPAGSDFLAHVCTEWERATRPAAEAGIRVIHLRTGIVLAKEGGALAKMVTPFKLGVGGKIGSGMQFMSWIDLEDEVQVILHCLREESLQGAVNSVGPAPVRNAEFTRTLGRVLSRPAVFPLPAFVARLAFGEMADALLLSSQRVEPAKLRASGFSFRHTDLEETLRRILR